MPSVDQVTSDHHHFMLQTIGYESYVQKIVDNTMKSIRYMNTCDMKHKDKSINFAKEKLRVYLLLLKRDQKEIRLAIDNFKEISSSMLTDVMEGELGNIGIVHGKGVYSHETIKLDEQSRQVASSLKNSIDGMEFLLNYLSTNFSLTIGK